MKSNILLLYQVTISKAMMKKILKIGGILILGLLIALLLAPMLFQDKIVEAAKTEVNKNINADLDFSDISLSFFKAFPFPSLSVDDVTIKGHEPFESKTLLKADEIFIQIGLASLFKNEALDISKIRLSRPVIDLQVNKDGKANWDITIPSEASTSSESESLNLNINYYEISEGTVSYTDDQTSFSATIEEVNHSGTGDFTDDVFTLNTETELKGIDIINNKIKVANGIQVTADLPIQVNMTQSKYAVSKGLININDFKLLADGSVQMAGDDIIIDFTSSANDNSVKEFLSLIPYAYTKDYKDVTASGAFDYRASAKGVYNENRIPAFDVNIKLTDASVRYPDLTLPIDNINLSLEASNSSGNMDKTNIALRPLQFKIDGEPFMASLVSNNDGQRDFDFALNTDLDISKIAKAYPIEGLKTLSGRIKADVKSNGLTADLESQDFSKITSEGKIDLQDFIYESGAVNVEVAKFKGDYNKDELIIEALQAKSGNNDIAGTGKLSNLLNFYLNDKKLSGQLQLKSTVMDLNDYISEEVDTASADVALLSSFDNIDISANYSADKLIYDLYEFENFNTNAALTSNSIVIESGKGDIGTSDIAFAGKLDNLYQYLYQDESLTGQLTINSNKIDYADFSEEPTGTEEVVIPIIPENVEIDIAIKADKIIYDSYNINNAVGSLAVIPSAVNIKSFKGSTFGGDIDLEGYYSSEDINNPGFGLRYNMSNMRIAEAVKSNKTFKILAPIASYIEGVFNSTFVLEGILDQTLMPDFSSLTGSGFFETLEGKISGFGPIDKLKSYLNLDKGKEWVLKNNKNWFEIKDGALQVREFDYGVKEVLMKISGSHSFNMDMDYVIKTSIPRKYLESNPLGAELAKEFDSIISSINKRGLNIEQNDYVDADLHMTGSILKPNIEIKNVRISNKSLTDQVKDQVRQKVEDKKNEIKDSVRTKVDNTVKTVKDTIATKTQEIKDTVGTLVNKEINEKKDQAAAIAKSQIDTLLKGRLPDSTITDISKTVEGILGEDTKISVDSIMNKIKNPFKFGKKKKGN